MDHMVDGQLVAAPANYATHNGEITMVNPETDGRRTIRIRTQPDNAQFAAGERIISLLVGPDNERSYKGFGFVKDDGRIIVWRKFRSGVPGQPSIHEKLALMVQYPEHYEALGVQYLFSTCCRRCNRLLTTPESIESGIGPICAGRE